MTSQHLIQSIGWTFIHSLWQGLAVYVLVKGTFALVRKADVRYGIGVLAMCMMVISALITFFVLSKTTSSQGFYFIVDATASASAGSISFLQVVLNFIDQNIIWMLRFWMIGFAAGMLRLAAGLWYINRLRRNAIAVQDEWTELVNTLSNTLDITRVVTMAEAAIASPMVVGFVKPMILFPVGLLAGLTTEQVETILVHELSHIRRQDYIINLVQSVIDTIFFFNPFALLISALIREERENCCDDLVIAKGISPISYVKTLAQLEASRSSSSLALGIAGNQNQLLNRIKRIMENSAKNDWGKGRLVPVALLFLGLICASWITIGSEKKEATVKEITSARNVGNVFLAADTAKDDLKVIRKRYNGWNIEEPPVPGVPEPPDAFIEIWEDTPDHVFEFSFDDMVPPSIDFDTPMIPDMLAVGPQMFQGLDSLFQYQVFDGSDSIPAYKFHLRQQDADWDSFEKELREKFKSQFKDFYNKNQKQFDKMLDDMKNSEASRRDAADVVDLQRMARKNRSDDAMVALEMAKHNKILAEQHLMQNKVEMNHAKQLSMEISKMAANQQYQASKMQMDILNNQYMKQAEMYRDMSGRFGDFKKALTEQLAADGYIKAGDQLDQVNINDDNGDMVINGKTIKEKDRIKYKALQDQYFTPEPFQRKHGRSE